MSDLQTETYLRAPFETMEDVAQVAELWDATTAGWVARCPRYGEYKILYQLQPPEEGYQLTAGKAVHVFLDMLYAGVDPDLALDEMRLAWGHDADWRLPPGHRFQHLHLGHLEVICKNYLDYSRKRDTFKPLLIRREELKLDRVLAGVWRLTDNGLVILGESKFIMEFPLTLPDGKTVVYVHAGKPDLPIEMAGGLQILDNKTTSSYLSDWYFSQYKFSNQLRGYCAMLHELTDYRVGGALINGIFVGEKATSDKFSGSKFARFGPMSFQPSHLNEALLNQYYWKKQLFTHHEEGYFPQNPGKHCGSCEMATLCNASVATRQNTMRTDYKQSTRNVMDTFLSL